MTDREFEAIMVLVDLLRSDIGVASKVLAVMTKRGFSAEETQAAVNEVAKRLD